MNNEALRVWKSWLDKNVLNLDELKIVLKFLEERIGKVSPGVERDRFHQEKMSLVKELGTRFAPHLMQPKKRTLQEILERGRAMKSRGHDC